MTVGRSSDGILLATGSTSSGGTIMLVCSRDVGRTGTNLYRAAGASAEGGGLYPAYGAFSRCRKPRREGSGPRQRPYSEDTSYTGRRSSARGTRIRGGVSYTSRTGSSLLGSSAYGVRKRAERMCAE